MIDEDLYQQATDELNSDKRLPHIWARACALASDDHDEARYLYTNLRVEELIEERESSGSSPAVEELPVTEDQHSTSLALEPLTLDEDIPESISAPSGVDQNRAQEEILTLNSEMAKNNELIDSIERKSFEEKFDSSEKNFDNIDAQDDSDYSDEYLDETINLTSELDGTAVFELDKSDATEFDDDDLGDPDDALVEDQPETLSGNDEDDELEALLGGIYLGSPPSPATDPLAEDDAGAPVTLDFQDASGAHGILSEERDDLELQQFPAQLPIAESRDETGRLAQEIDQELVQELERQANELPGQHSDIVAVNDGLDKYQEEQSQEQELHEEELHEEELQEQEFQEDEFQEDGYQEDQSLISSDHEILSGDTFDEEAERDIRESLQRNAANQNPAMVDDDANDSSAPRILEEDANDLPAQPDADDNEDSTTRKTADISELPAVAAITAAGTTAASHAAERSVPELPVDLSEGNSGTRYTVFRRGDQAQAVKNGVSWSALFLTLPYLIYRHLFGTALVYGVLWLILLAGLLVAGLAWLDAGTAANPVLKYTTVGFALLAVIGLLYIPFRYSNQWREDKLEQRGFELVAWVRASSAGKAISAARKAATFD